MRFVLKQDAPSFVKLIKASTASLEDMQNDCANSLQPAVCEIDSDNKKTFKALNHNRDFQNPSTDHHGNTM